MARKKIRTSTDQRPFSLTYHDFIDSEILKSNEITLFVVLKRFADGDGNCFPSLKKLSAKTGLSKRKVQDLLKALEEKKVITKEKRTRADGGDTSNFYHLNDTAEMWQSGNVEEMKAAVDEIEEQRMIEILTARGYTISKEPEKDKEKGLESDTNQSTQTSTQNSNHKDNTIKQTKSQAPQPIERYPVEQLKAIYDYSTLVNNPKYQEDIEVVLDIIYDTVNNTDPKVKVGKEIKPIGVVSSRLLKLDQSDLMYAIDTYHNQTSRIKNTRSYMLTILYYAKEQAYLDLTNLGHNKGDF